MLHYQNALEQQPDSSLLHFRVGEILFHGNNYQEAALEFAKALTGDLQPRWTVVFSHIALGRIFDVTGQPERAAGEYQRAIRTGDNSQNAISYAHSYPENPLASSDHDLPSVSTKFDSFPPLPAVVDLFVEAKGEAGIAEWEGVVLLEAAGRQEATQEVWKVLLSSGLDTDSLAMEAAE